MASSALAREKPNGQSPRECPGIASSMTAGSFVDTSEDCDEVNLKEETLDDELKVYCVFHSDLVFIRIIRVIQCFLLGPWFTSSPSSASAVIETLRRRGERDETSNRWIRHR